MPLDHENDTPTDELEQDTELQGGGTQADEDARIEREARAQGWRPDKFGPGDPRNKSAREFVDAGTRILSEQRQQNETLQRMIRQQQLQIEHQRQQYEEKIEQLKADKKQAILAGDADAVDKLDEQIGRTQALADGAKAIQEPPVTQPAGPSPEVIAWAQRNPWFKDNDPNDAMTLAAVSVAKQLRDQLPKGTSEAVFIELLEARLDKALPNRNRRQTMPSVDDGGNRTTGGQHDQVGDSIVIDGRRYTYNDLPREARQACDRTVDKNYTRKDYLRDYFGG